MYTGSENVPIETYMIPGTGVNTQITLLAPPEGLDYMANEAAPEAFFDQGLYYPAANYYGYYCTGHEPQGEWDDHRFFGVDGQELHYSSGFQAESYPYVYYPPNYGYAQSSYNPYNPYIPGAVIGVDGSFIGTQQYFTNPSYLPPSSPAGYVPLVVQPGSDVSNNSGGSSVYGTTAPMSSRQGNAGLKYQNQRASANRGPNSQRITSGIQTSESSHSASSEVSVNTLPSKQSSSHGAVTPGNATQMTQGKISSGSVQAANHFTDGRVSPVQNPSKLTVPSNNILPNYGSNIHGWATMERPRSQYHGTTNNGNGSPDILSEQNRGPRTTRTRGQWTSVIDGPQMIDVCATNAQGAIVIQTDQYNKDDFPVDYPYAKFFVIKSYSEDDVHKSIKYNVWSSTPNGNKRLSSAYEDAQRISVGKPRNCPIFLFFSVNASGQFCGVAEMTGPVDFHKDMDFWQQDKWNGSFPVKWHFVKDVPNTSFRHILLENNENKPVTNSRDTQEITYVPGMNMLNIFKTSPLKTSILDDFMFYEERQKIMQEEKSRFLGRSYTSYLPAVVPINKGNATGEQTVSANKFKKEEGKQLDVAIEQAKKADAKQTIGQPPMAETIPAKESKTSGTAGPSNEQKFTSKVDATRLSEVKEDAKPKGDGKPHLEVVDANVASSIEKMNALSIVSEEGEANCHKNMIEESSTPSDVVTVGSMHFKVNGAGEISSKTITIGTIPIEPKV